MTTKKSTGNVKATTVADITAVPPPPPVGDVPPPPPADLSVAPKAPTITCYQFVKNYNTKEVMNLGGGETFAFPANSFHTSDSVLAEKIRKVAHLYKIVENEPSEV
jgi:hypothetical protein